MGENALGVKVSDTLLVFFLHFRKMEDTIPVMLDIYDTSISLISIFASFPALRSVLLGLFENM